MPKQLPVGPSWTEVFLGAFLSLVIGATLGAAYLVLKPAVLLRGPLKEEERKAETIYYTEGSRDGNKGRQGESKRKLFAQGSSVTVNEDEINLAIPPAKAPAPPAPVPGAKPGEKPAAPAATAVVAPPNVRIREGVVQISTPIKVSVFGFDSNVVVLARGGFVKKSSGWVFEPDTISAGSCPLDRLPVVKTLVFNKFIGSQPVPEDIATSWAKLAAVSVQGNELKLTMPQ
ncbi:MAG TPA: hypothetical protein VHO24_07915 [Opitutaceae bacterium]|nr:hypothetical protein [Opitutaceae bacterium]